MADLEEDKATQQPSEANDLRRLVTAVSKHSANAESGALTEHCLNKVEEVVGSLEGDLKNLTMPSGVSISSWRVSSTADSTHYKATQAEIELPSCNVSIVEKAHSGKNRVDYIVREGETEVRFETTKNVNSKNDVSSGRAESEGMVKKIFKGLFGSD